VIKPEEITIKLLQDAEEAIGWAHFNWGADCVDWRDVIAGCVNAWLKRELPKRVAEAAKELAARSEYLWSAEIAEIITRAITGGDE
jgi:hypothetical protein